MKSLKLRLIFFFLILLAFSINGNAKSENCFALDKKDEGKKYENGNFFGSIENYDSNLIKTAMSSMTHSCMITQKEGRETFKLLTKKGWKLISEKGTPAINHSEGLIEPRAGRAYVAYNESINTMVVVFRGTGVKGMGKGYKLKLIKNALTDSNLRLNKIMWLPSSKNLEQPNSKQSIEIKKWKGLTIKNLEKWKNIKVHNGFNKEYKRFERTIGKRIESFFYKNKKTPNIYCIGFSLGAALATHCGAHLKFRFGINPNVLVGASPRVGGREFQKAYDKLINKSARIMLEKDPVPQIPGNLIKKLYKHVGHKLLPLYHDKRIGERLKERALKIITHSWKNARVGRDIFAFIKYHNYIQYKAALRKHLRMCKSDCKKGTLENLARAEKEFGNK